MDIPKNAIRGDMTLTSKIGETILRTGQKRKQNVFYLDFGELALSGNLYGKIDGSKYDVYLIPKVK